MARFSAIRLDRLPFPDIVTRLDFEAVLADFKAKFAELRPDLADVLSLESNPVVALLETFAYFYMTKLGEENDKAKGLMLPYATGTTLDVLAYNLFGTSRLDGETDDELRNRAMLSWEALSTAGPSGAYVFHALSAHAKVGDVAVLGPDSGEVDPGQVKVVLLSKEGNGVPTPDVVSAVLAYLNDDERRPLTDQVLVEPAGVRGYTVEATLYISPGPGAAPIRQAAIDKLDAYVTARHKIGAIVPLSGIMAALHVEGVERVALTSPTADVAAQADEAPYCSGYTVLTEVES